MDISQERFLRNFPNYEYIQTKYIFKVCITCGWVRITKQGYLKPTERGYELLSNNNSIDSASVIVSENSSGTWIPVHSGSTGADGISCA